MRYINLHFTYLLTYLQNNRKMAVRGQIKIFRIILLLRFNRAHRLTFSPEFHADLSRHKEKPVHCTLYKTPTFSPPFCAPLAHGAKILTREI